MRPTTSWTTKARSSGSAPIWTRRAAGSLPWTRPNQSARTGGKSSRSATETLTSVNTLNDSVHLQLPQGCAKPGEGILAGRPVAARSRAARHRLGRRLPAANAHDTETFYSFTSFTMPGTIYRYDLAPGCEHRVPRAQGGFQSGGLRNQADILHEQGRHARADVHHPPARA